MSKKYRVNMKNITKKFPGVTALKNVDFNVKPGEVHVLVGENGAGKSTLMKILTGAYSKTSGELYIEGNQVKINNPYHALNLGISMIYQEFNLARDLNIQNNIFLGREKMKNGKMKLLDENKMYKESKKILNKLNIEVDPKRKIKNLGIAQQQMVEIVKALSVNARVIIMDEPTASLTEDETENLFKVIKQLREDGISIIFISHQLEEVSEIGDRVTVLRDGKKIDTMSASIKENKIVELMVGRSIDEFFPTRHQKIGKEILRVDNLSRNNELKNISFNVYKGEVLGIAGLVGAGRTELVRAIFGADPIDEGQIFVNGKKVNINSPGEAIREGLGLLPESRKEHGLALDLSVKENITLSNLDDYIKKGIINKDKEMEIANKYIKEVQIKTPSENQKVKYLSGGNQQKVVVAKWLSRNCDILFFDEPTRGIDVGAKKEIYNIINELVENGTTVIMVSSYLPEVLGMSDRILVMSEGEITGELDIEEATQEKIMSYAAMNVE